ncbi:MAG: TolB family protein [Candidatus Xenobia bacterium]
MVAKAVGAPNLSAGATALLKDKALPLDAHTEVGSLSETGGLADRTAEGASLSTDGRYVAFQSAAQNLVEGTPHDTKQIYVRDRRTGEVDLASISSQGEPGNDDSWHARMSAAGRYVAFTSKARNLAPDSQAGLFQIYRHDMTSDETVRIGVAAKQCQQPAISADGHKIAFRAQDGPGWNDNADVYVVDVASGKSTKCNSSSAGVRDIAISGNGRYVAFAGRTVGRTTSIFVYDCQTGQTELASGGIEGENYSPSLSADGRTVAWSHAGGGVSEILVKNLDQNTTENVAMTNSGQPADGNSYHPSLSGDGRYVAFESDSKLLGGQGIGMRNVFVHDRVQHRTEMMKATNQTGQSGNPALSADGSMIAWESGCHVMPQDIGMGVLVGHNLARPEASHEAFQELTKQVQAEQQANAVEGIEEGDGFVRINGLTLVALEPSDGRP